MVWFITLSVHLCQTKLTTRCDDRRRVANILKSRVWHKVPDGTYITYIRLTALCPGLPRWAGTRKVKPIWILLKQETVSGSGISWAICKSASRSRQITMPIPHHSSFFTGRMPFLPPNQQRQSTEGTIGRPKQLFSPSVWAYQSIFLDCVGWRCRPSMFVSVSRENLFAIRQTVTHMYSWHRIVLTRRIGLLPVGYVGGLQLFHFPFGC